MERNTENKVLSFSKGMTTMPSDLLCEDSELTECRNLIYSSGEVKPIQKAVSIGAVDSAYTIKYVHKMADYENIICYDGSSVCWYSRNEDGTIGSMQQSFNVGEAYNITSVGNTLVVSTADGLHYMLFKSGKYKDLGTGIPKPNFSPYFSDFTNVRVPLKQQQQNIYSFVKRSTQAITISNDGLTVAKGGTDMMQVCEIDTTGDKYTNFKTAMTGLIEEADNARKDKNQFAFPFYIRFAWRFFDGSYSHISEPIVCYPSIRKNLELSRYNAFIYGGVVETEAIFYKCRLYRSTLYFSLDKINGISDWSDIISNLVVFASDDVKPYSVDDDFKVIQPWDYAGETNADFLNPAYEKKRCKFKSMAMDDNTETKYPDYTCPGTIFVPESFKSDEEIIDELKTKTQFYKLFELKASMFEKTHIGLSSLKYIKEGVVSTLEEQEQLKVDDYFSWTKLVPNNIYPYNSRLNMFGLKRYPWKGFNLFGAIKTTESQFEFYVHIVSESIDCWVKSDSVYSHRQLFGKSGGWLYYPDPNAKEMLARCLTEGGGAVLISLEQHPYLNGAYSFANLPTEAEFPESDESDEPIPAVDTSAYESLDSNIYTSVVNNPYVFEASGDNTVGTGKILGIAANTEAISQGQFGQYPLFLFTNEGIYAMAVNSEGLSSSIYPVSREVCNNADSITPTDRLVYFTSAKGLMAISGGTVVNVSEQMRGRLPKNFCELEIGFINFLTNCIIAYDYRDSLLRIFGFNGTTPRDWQYIFNMADKTFSTLHHDMKAIAVVNDYPDNLIQDEDGYIYSLSSKPNINDDTNSYAGTLTTRPLKLGGSITLKSLRKIRHLLDSLDGKMELEIWGSNNTKHWQKLTSLLGKPWAYYTFKYTFSNLKATDAFSGSVVTIQNRRETR